MRARLGRVFERLPLWRWGCQCSKTHSTVVGHSQKHRATSQTSQTQHHARDPRSESVERYPNKETVCFGSGPGRSRSTFSPALPPWSGRPVASNNTHGPLSIGRALSNRLLSLSLSLATPKDSATDGQAGMHACARDGNPAHSTRCGRAPRRARLSATDGSTGTSRRYLLHLSCGVGRVWRHASLTCIRTRLRVHSAARALGKNKCPEHGCSTVFADPPCCSALRWADLGMLPAQILEILEVAQTRLLGKVAEAALKRET